MKTLIVYDSVYGNTEIVAQAIGHAIPGEVQVRRVGQVNAGDLETADLLIIGSPTHGALPTEAVQALLNKIGAPAREGVRWFLEVVIADTGVGVPPQIREKIFSPFYTTRTQGTGLGLSITRKIVEQAGGTIAVASEPGAGTTFTVRIPRLLHCGAAVQAGPVMSASA